MFSCLIGVPLVYQVSAIGVPDYDDFWYKKIINKRAQHMQRPLQEPPLAARP